MKRLNITFTDRQIKLLARERKQTGVATSTLLRQLIDRYFQEKASERKQTTQD